MAITSVTLNDLIFNGLVCSIKWSGKNDLSSSGTKSLHMPTYEQFNDGITQLVNCFFPPKVTQEKVRFELQVSRNNILSILSLQLPSPAKLDRHKLLVNINHEHKEMLTKTTVKSPETIMKIQQQSDYAIENVNVPYDQYVKNFLCTYSSETMELVKLKNHFFVLAKTDNDVCSINQIIEPMLKNVYYRFRKLNQNSSLSGVELQDIFHQLTDLLSCVLFILWCRAHRKITDNNHWNYWYSFVLVVTLVCVLLDAYCRRVTKKSGIQHIISEVWKIDSLLNVVAFIDKDQLKEISSVYMSIIQKDYDWKDDPVKNAEIEKAFTAGILEFGERLKTIIKHYNDAMCDGQDEFGQTIGNKDEEESMFIIDEAWQDHGNHSITDKVYIVKCALGFRINEDDMDTRYDSFARLAVLHAFNLDIRDVTQAVANQHEIEWPDKSVDKLLIVTLLRSAQNDGDKTETESFKLSYAESITNEWTIEKDMIGVDALAKLKITLADLSRYFNYNAELRHTLRGNAHAINVTSNMSTLDSTEFPTFCNEKIWKLIECYSEARKAVEIHHNYRACWDMLDVLSTKLVRLGFGKKGTGRLVAATDQTNSVRVILHIGNHNSDIIYRNRAHAGVVAIYNGSEEKKLNPNLTFIDFLRLGSNVFDISSRFVENKK